MASDEKKEVQIQVISSSSINKKVTSVLSHLHASPDALVSIRSKSSVASKLISIVEIVKRSFLQLPSPHDQDQDRSTQTVTKAAVKGVTRKRKRDEQEREEGGGEGKEAEEKDNDPLRLWQYTSLSSIKPALVTPNAPLITKSLKTGAKTNMSRDTKATTTTTATTAADDDDNNDDNDDGGHTAQENDLSLERLNRDDDDDVDEAAQTSDTEQVFTDLTSARASLAEEQSRKNRQIPILTIYLSRVPLKKYQNLYGEQICGKK